MNARHATNLALKFLQMQGFLQEGCYDYPTRRKYGANGGSARAHAWVSVAV
jgi:hypothetical protein